MKKNLCVPCAEEIKAEGKRNVVKITYAKRKQQCTKCDRMRYCYVYDVKRIVAPFK